MAIPIREIPFDYNSNSYDANNFLAYNSNWGFANNLSFGFNARVAKRTANGGTASITFTGTGLYGVIPAQNTPTAITATISPTPTSGFVASRFTAYDTGYYACTSAGLAGRLVCLARGLPWGTYTLATSGWPNTSIIETFFVITSDAKGNNPAATPKMSALPGYTAFGDSFTQGYSGGVYTYGLGASSYDMSFAERHRKTLGTMSWTDQVLYNVAQPGSDLVSTQANSGNIWSGYGILIQILNALGYTTSSPTGASGGYASYAITGITSPGGPTQHNTVLFGPNARSTSSGGAQPEASYQSTRTFLYFYSDIVDVSTVKSFIVGTQPYIITDINNPIITTSNNVNPQIGGLANLERAASLYGGLTAEFSWVKVAPVFEFMNYDARTSVNNSNGDFLHPSDYGHLVIANAFDWAYINR